MKAFSIVVVLVVLAPVYTRAAGEFRPDADGLHYADVVQAASGADEVRVFEGMPRAAPKVARGADAPKPSPTPPGEINFVDKISLEIGGYAFYALPVTLTAAELGEIGDAVMKTKSNFNPWSGVKFCGGFHPDFVIEWRAHGAILAQALLCFSCGEAIFRVGDRKELVDQSPAGAKYFKAFLLPHRHGATQASKP